MALSFVKPQVQVFQEFELLPDVITANLSAVILGPQANLHRYTDEDEKPLISLGDYDADLEVSYDWPGKATGSNIDLEFVKLFIDDAKLRYFRDLIGTGGTVTPVEGQANQVYSSAYVFKTANDVDRSDEFLDRDVKIGDGVKISGIGSDSELYEIDTYVKDFAADVSDGVVGTEFPASTNETTLTAAISIDRVAGPKNNISIGASGAAYDGREDGVLDETYTLEVTLGSVGGDLTTALLRVTSASGLDNDLKLRPEAAGLATPIGDRGLTVTWDIEPTSSGSSAAELEEASPGDLVAGQKWRVHVRQDFTPPDATAGGSYTGEEDTTYIVEVTKGGALGALPEITVTTTTGIDVSGPTKVTGSGDATGIGTFGTTIAFTGASGLCKGDKYYVPVTAAANGSLKTLVLGHDLPDELLEATDLNLELYILKDIEVSENRIGSAPLVNWEADNDEFILKSGITAFDASWTEDDEQVALPVVAGSLYLHYREWVATNTSTIRRVDDVVDIPTLAGPVDPDNPLGYALSKALANSNGSPIWFIVVAEPDEDDSWLAALKPALGRTDLYNFVPLTHLRSVQNLVAAHVADRSSPLNGQWRAAFFNLQANATVAIVDDETSSNEEVVLATIADNPDKTGTQYTLMTVTSDNAELIQLGVRPGDVARFLFSTDGFGNETYEEFVIDHVRSEGTLVLEDAHTVAITEPQKVEIWRPLTKDEIATEVGERAASFASSRVCVVWPDEIPSAGVEVPGYHLCAALAGLRSGVVPHQGLTNVQVVGFDEVPRSTEFFSGADLDTLAASGVWVVTESGGVLFNYKAITTDTTDVNHVEEMVRANVDSISYLLQSQLVQFIGKTNVTPSTLDVISVTIQAGIEFLKARGITPTLGGQLIDGVIVSVVQHALLKDRVVATVRLTIPYVLNVLELHLAI